MDFKEVTNIFLNPKKKSLCGPQLPENNMWLLLVIIFFIYEPILANDGLIFFCLNEV